MTVPSVPSTEAWRPRARKVVVLASLVALGTVLLAAAIVWTWRHELPDPVASHWSAAGEPDGFMSLEAFALSSVLLVAGCVALFGAIGWSWGTSASTRRTVGAATVWSGAFGATLLLAGTASQRGLDDATQATSPGGALALALVLPLVPAVLAALVVPGDPREPATTPVADDAARVPLAEGERAVWIRRADGVPGLAVGALAIALTAVLAVVLQLWAMLVVPALLAVVLAAMFAFTVRVDASGLTVRSALGWPSTRVPADEIVRADVTRVRPLRDFGGWGWRVGQGGRTGVVLRAGEALEVERTGGRVLVVTVDDAATAAGLLNTVAERTR
ncbi:DUF1648 domain-containing protein [Isoptericola variabilis]|uniref:DUF1648 domain-containing protein n=1 Tax=Isoptericola variabilis (strain 225) TaxID=743718 RepID=F6FQX3_ISOV2|nr:DUF1648 domain-containing protein [Isoptericola variabilis]AEG43858.1 hypothetical protein Isova_1079 [Isoptericola variabilis 225]TWH34164.1 uncharacterized protein DUF1648 [Isoptericola variabilis J7]